MPSRWFHLNWKVRNSCLLIAGSEFDLTWSIDNLFQTIAFFLLSLIHHYSTSGKALAVNLTGDNNLKSLMLFCRL